MKMCKYHPDKRCYHSSCSIFNPFFGTVVLCPLFRGGALFTPRKVVLVDVSVFVSNKRLKSRSDF